MELNDHAMIRKLSLKVGSRLKQLRIERGLTQKQLAARISGGVDYTYIGKIERGQQLPSLKVLLKVSECFSIQMGYFFGEVSESRVYLNCPSKSGDVFSGEKGEELLRALKHLTAKDVPIIVEIIRTLARHRESDKYEIDGESLTSDVIFSLSGNMGQPRKKGSDN